MIKAVIFDCFGVLYLDPSLRFYEKYVSDFEEQREAIMAIDRAYDRGIMSEEQNNRAIAELTGLSYDLVHGKVRGEHVRNDALLSYSQTLRADMKVGMLSNIGHGGMEYFFSERERAEYFDEVILSSDVGMIKPERDIFLLMAVRLGVTPDECVMIDDREDNVLGARAAGMKAILYTSVEQCRRELAALVELDAGIA